MISNIGMMKLSVNEAIAEMVESRCRLLNNNYGCIFACHRLGILLSPSCYIKKIKILLSKKKWYEARQTCSHQLSIRLDLCQSRHIHDLV